MSRSNRVTSDFHLAELDHGGGRPTMLCGYVRDLQIVVHTPAAPRPAEWSSYLRSSIAEGTVVTFGIVRTLGGSPDAAQRREAADYWRTEAPAEIKFAVLTDVALHRPVIRALNLFQRVPVKPFPGRAMRDALAYLGTRVPIHEVKLHMEWMAQRLGIDITPVH